jgi:hypothetical protein
MTESLPLIAKWFGRAGKVMEYVPGLKGVAKGYEAIAEIADGLNLVYELVNELDQTEALEKGTKELIKRTKPVAKTAERLLKKKYPNMPEPARKELAKRLQQLFEKFVSDPAAEKLKKEAEEIDPDKQMKKSLVDEWKKMFSPVTP